VPPATAADRCGTGRVRPETNLYIFSTGNPTPGYTGISRKGDNLFTCTLMAVNMSTGKMAWYYQTSPHDTHDWDSAQTPVLIDGVIDGKPRKLVSTAARNGYFFTLDRVTGEHIVTAPFGKTINWSKGSQVGPAGTRSGEVGHRAGFTGFTDGSWCHQLAAARVQPRPGAFLCSRATASTSCISPTPIRAARWAWVASAGRSGLREQCAAGHRLPQRQGRVAARIAAGREHGRRAAHRQQDFCSAVMAAATSWRWMRRTATSLWHTRIGSISNAPQTFEIDGRQHVLVGVGDMLYSFAIY
jgi:alcohol dehydrogenase (cytochrome c)